MKFKDTAILTTPKHLGVLEAPKFKDDFKTLCELRPKKIAIDMGSTKLITSVGLGALVNSLKASHAMGIELVLRNVNPQVISVLSMTNLSDIFPIEATTSVAWTKNVDKPSQLLELTSRPQHVWQAINISVAVVGLGITASLVNFFSH